MKKYLEHIIKKALLAEQDAPAGDAAATTPLETDNAPSDAKDSPFTPAEERFLGKFDAYGSKHLGILYSTSDAGVREFIARSGKELNVSPGILRNLFRKKIIKFVPYTGFGRNDDYTIELQLSLDDVKGLGKADQAKAETGAQASGAAPAGGGAPPPPPENAGVIRYGHVITEMLNEQTSKTVSPLSNEQRKRCNDAIGFWENIAEGTRSYNWDETELINTLLAVSSKQEALYIDAIGYIFTYNESKQHPEYLKFISDLGTDALTFTALPISLEQPAYTIPRLLNSTEFLQSVFYDDLSSDDDYKKIKNAYVARGIGQLVMSSDVQKTGKGAKYFYPAYTTGEVYALVKKLTEPYLSSKDVEQQKEKDRQKWIAKQSEQVKQQIVSTKKLQFKSYNGLYSKEADWIKYIDSRYGWNKRNLTNVDDITMIMHFQKSSGVFDYDMSRTPIKFIRTYQNKAGKYYAAFRAESSRDTIYRLYADGTITRDVPGAVGKYWTFSNGIYVEWSYDKKLDVTPKDRKVAPRGISK
jgi:hypothetical protein